MPNTKNFAYSTVLTAPSPAASGTSLVVQSGNGANFPSTSFNATVWPAGVRPTAANAEVVTVSNISTDTFTIVRSAESSSARSIIVGDQIAATITAGLFPTGTIAGTTDTQTLTGKTVSDTLIGKVFDTTLTQRDTTLPASNDYVAYGLLENSASYVLEIPATSTLEVAAPPVTQTNPVQGNQIAAGAITLGYAQITSNATQNLTSATQITGLSVTVNIPAGGRRVKITICGGDMFNNTANATCTLSIWDGVVGTGTQLGQSVYNEGSGSNVTVPVICMAVPPAPSAAVKTYNASFHVSAGSGTIECSATSPTFILVEAI